MRPLRRSLERATVAAGLLISCALAPAQATVLSFDNWTASTSSIQIQDGWLLRFSGSSYGTYAAGTLTESVGGNALTSDGSTRLGAAGPQGGAGARITLQRADGAMFSVQAFDAASLLSGLGVTQLLVGYNTASNIDVWTTLSIDDSFSTYLLSGASSVRRLWFTEAAAYALGSSGGLSIDNIRVNEPGYVPPVTVPVPEPATLLLVGAAVAGLAASRRRGLHSSHVQTASN